MELCMFLFFDNQMSTNFECINSQNARIKKNFVFSTKVRFFFFQRELKGFKSFHFRFFFFNANFYLNNSMLNEKKMKK